MVNPMVLALRKSLLAKQPLVVYAQVASSGKTVAALATATGYSQDDAEKYLGLLVDDAIVSRSMGMRATATYQLA